MNVVVLRQVVEFIETLDGPVRIDVERLIDLLKEYGHELPMPYAKPVGNKLWELRRTGRPHIRVLYGFCRGNVVLVLALKKQRSALRGTDITLARKRLDAFCA